PVPAPKPPPFFLHPRTPGCANGWGGRPRGPAGGGRPPRGVRPDRRRAVADGRLAVF
ncbi:hypothetical protein MUNTM_53080, partial [Mycobacterium sp. MUNTM1]